MSQYLRRHFNHFRLTTSILALVAAGCSIMYTRPVQDMSDTGAAVKAAREVQADILAPELFRQASEWFFKAKREYKFKNFKLAKEYSNKARYFAEQAEFEAIRNGATRSDQPVADSYSDKTQGSAASTAQESAPKSKEPYPYPTPTGTPADEYEARAKQNAPAATPSQSPGLPSSTGSGPTPSTTHNGTGY